MIAILISFTLLFVILYIPALMVNKKDYKSIKSTYKELGKIKFHKLDETFIYGKSTITGEIVIWFKESGDFKTNETDSYIFNSFIFLIDPYYAFWYIRYNNWFNKKLKIDELEETDSPSL